MIADLFIIFQPLKIIGGKHANQLEYLSVPTHVGYSLNNFKYFIVFLKVLE